MYVFLKKGWGLAGAYVAHILVELRILSVVEFESLSLFLKN